MKNLVMFWLIMIITTNGCTEEQGVFVVSKKKFKLVDNESLCQLKDHETKEKFDLLIPWPCQVHRNPKGEVRIYKESGKQYFLIESSRPYLNLPGNCETQLQSIKVYQGTAKPSEFSDLVSSCLPFQWDTKVFTGLFN